MPPLETPGHSQSNLNLSLVGSCPFLLGLCAHRLCLCPPRVYFSVLCKFWQLYGGVNGDLLEESLCHIQVCCTQSPCPCGRPLLTCTSTGDTQTVKGRSGSVSVGSPGVHKILFEPSECVWWVWGLILNVIFLILLSCWASPLLLDMGYLFLVGSNILLSMVVQQCVVILEFLQEKMNARPSIPVSLTVSLSHQEASISLLSFSIRGQTE